MGRPRKGSFGLHPEVYRRYLTLRAHLVSYGFPVSLTSTLRSRALQLQLFNAWRAGRTRYPAAPPGRSLHEAGRAFDISSTPDGLAVAGELAPYLGLRWGGKFSVPDPVHFEV